ncbi:MAG: molybdopterin molybdotransferase MoeA [Sneathiella sp.]|nr:molybdopterin molybdotransferase MoeA [Sneathiella sp.]
MTRLVNDCFSNASEMITVQEARKLIADATIPITTTEIIELYDANNRILAQDIYSTLNVPPANNSAVDGYAFCFADHLKNPATPLDVLGRSAAGQPFDGNLNSGQCVKIFTGAVVPAGCDTIAMIEDTRLSGNTVLLPQGLKEGTNCRLAGEDIRKDSLLLTKGTYLRPQELGYLASIGIKEIQVSKKLKVALFSTGDELNEPGEALQSGKIYDSNRVILNSLLLGYGCEVYDYGIVPDEFETLRSVLEKAAEDVDLIITSGGVSMGDEDHVKAAVEDTGNLHFWRIAIKPGRPLAVGQVANTAFVGLPGNPVAALVCAMQFVRPLIASLCGDTSFQLPIPITGTAQFSMKKKPGRREWSRGRYSIDRAGKPIVEKYFTDGSGIVSSLIWANGLIELAENITEVKEGDPVTILPFTELFR